MSLILSTGGLGFIGSHSCINLIQNGYDVLIIDSLINSSEKNLTSIRKILEKYKYSKYGKISFLKGDLLDKNWLESVFNKQYLENNPINSVIHFAGIKSVEESISNPLKYWNTNINATLNLLEIMTKFNCKSFVFSSSATIYEPLKNKKLFEDASKMPTNPYGNTKISIEKILNDVFISDNSWKIINLRYFNPVGSHYSGLLGENPKKAATNLFPAISKVLLGEVDQLLVFGNDWPTEDGTCIRDYIHVMDLAEAHIAALRYIESNGPQIISINIGTGQGYSVLEVIKIYSEVNKLFLPYKISERRKGDAPYVIADNTLALKLLEWIPKRTIEDMCKDSYKFIKSNFKLLK